MGACPKRQEHLIPPAAQTSVRIQRPPVPLTGKNVQKYHATPPFKGNINGRWYSIFFPLVTLFIRNEN
jgi:hypothetical protein